jgi:hypothetical protein
LGRVCEKHHATVVAKGQERTSPPIFYWCFSEGRTTSPSTDHVYTHTIRVRSRRTIQVHSHTGIRRTIRAHTHTWRTLRHGNGRTGGSVATAASALAPRGPLVTFLPVPRDRKQPRRWRKPAATMQALPRLLREPIRFSFGPPKLTALVYQEAWKREAGSGKFNGNSRPHARSSKIANHPSICREGSRSHLFGACTGSCLLAFEA